MQFDLCSKYGPVSGLTRMERWERAVKFGLNPPKRIHDLLVANPHLNQHLWHDLGI